MKIYKRDEFGKQLAKAVKQLRIQKNMTQEELREKAGFSVGYISRLEAGKYRSPSINHVYQLAQAMDMNLRELLESASIIF